MKNSEQPIYPVKEVYVKTDKTQKGYIYEDFTGLTKREYFAAMAMQGLLATTLKMGTMGIVFHIPTLRT